ncbi:MAG: hypothetical protein ACKV2Q_10595 [Planctomycetaceae bacterium]
MSRCKFSLTVTAAALLLLPALFVLKLSPAPDTVGAQESRPKQEYVPGQRPAEAPLRSPNRLATNQSAKPAGKMGFVPASPSTNQRSTVARPESVANPVARRAVAQPPKVAVAAGAAPDAPRIKNPDTSSVASRPARPQSPSQAQPRVVANQPPAPVPASRQFERPQPAIPTPDSPFETPEPVIAASQQQPTRTFEKPALAQPQLDEPEMELPASGKPPRGGVVQLYFDDEPVEGDSEEAMDLDKPAIATSKPSGIRPVATHGDLEQAQYTNDGDKTKKTRAESMAEILEDLKPVRQIELRKAVMLPKVTKPNPNPMADMKPTPPEPNHFTPLANRLPELKPFETLTEEEKDEVLKTPNDSASEMLRQRKPFNVFAIARHPWQANRDSYRFYHNPLWFEDPNLERCGRGWGPLTTSVSAIHFAANIPILPYRFTAEKPWSCVRTLPDCNSCEKFGYEAYLPPWSLSAAAVQAAATVGFIYAIP